MNSSVLVFGFVVIGFGTMAVLFNPFGSSDDTSSRPAKAYQAAATSSKFSAAANAVSKTSPVSAVATPEPFVWESKKETVASTGILDDVDRKPATKKVVRSEEVTSGLQGFGNDIAKISEHSQPKQQPVSKTVSSFGDRTVSTADADLHDFFGPSKAKTKVAQATKTQPPVTNKKPEPVRVASKPVANPTKSRSAWPTQKVKTSPNKDSDMVSFSAAKESKADNAPMLTAVESDDFDAPSFEPIDRTKATSKTDSRKRTISGSLEPVVNKPAVKTFDIENPLQTRLNVTFLANGKKVSLKPGQHFVVSQTEDVKVKFSRGGSFGFAEQSLSEGNYQFSVTRKDGWKLTQ